MAKKKKGKDPAFLMYSGDFLAGTYTMNYEQKGKYITLMCIHHQKGFLTDVDLQSVLSDTDILVASKFYKADNGNYYNQKMIDVINERKTYTENRLANLHKNKDKDNHIDTHKSSHMENHTEDEDEDEDINTDGNKIDNKDGSKDVNTSNNYGIYYKLYKKLTNYETEYREYEDIYFDIQDDIGWDKFYSVLKLSDKEQKLLDEVITIKLR